MYTHIGVVWVIGAEYVVDHRRTRTQQGSKGGPSPSSHPVYQLKLSETNALLIFQRILPPAADSN